MAVISRVAARTTAELHRTLHLPPLKWPGKRLSRYTPVEDLFKIVFLQFTFCEWPNFKSECCAVFEGQNNKQLGDQERSALQRDCVTSPDAQGAPSLENGIGNKLKSTVLNPVTTLQILDQQHTGHVWKLGEAANLVYDTQVSDKRPDFVLTDAACTVQGEVVGEIKTPEAVDLARATPVVIQTLISNALYATGGPFLPYLQVLAYALGSARGVGVLTTYETTRFFRLNLRSKTVEVSLCIRCDDMRNEDELVPHPFQAWLYVSKLEADTNNFNRDLQSNVLVDARGKLTEWRKARDLEKKARASEAKQKTRGRGSKRNPNTPSAGRTAGLIDVTSILLDSSDGRTIGHGLVGDVVEREYKGKLLAFKGTSVYVRGDEERPIDALAHLKEEIRNYEQLEELQGKVIPRMIGWGEDTALHPHYLLLVLEKVGLPLWRKGGELYIDGAKVSAENRKLLKEKALEAVAVLHEHDVLHGDLNVCNMRVEMKDGKVSRVWIIDLGKAFFYPSAQAQLEERRRVVRGLEDREMYDWGEWQDQWLDGNA